MKMYLAWQGITDCDLLVIDDILGVCLFLSIKERSQNLGCVSKTCVSVEHFFKAEVCLMTPCGQV